MNKGTRFIAGVGVGLFLTMSFTIGYMIYHYDEIKKEQSYLVMKILNAR